MKITSTTCPSKTPIRCSYDNSCVTDIGACASLLHLSCCRYPNLYSCFDGHCENTTNRCPHNKNCSEYCWNGECIDSGECPPLPSCPELTKRCWNGSCIDPNESCSPEPLCSEDETMCADGSCVNLNETCVEYNGCHPDLPILCPDGQCKSNYSDCFCPNNYQYLCYGGNCVVHPRECPVPPAMIKPLPVEYTIDLYQNSELTIISQTAEICKVRIDNSTVANSSLIIVRATAVADSLVRRVEPFRGWEGDVFDNILSPIVNLSIDGNYTGDFRITFFVPSYIFSPSYDGGLCLAKINESEQWSCLNDFPNIEPQNSGYAVTGVASFPGSFAIISFVEPVPTTETPAFSKKTSYTAGLWVLVISVVIVVVGLFVLTTFIFGYVKMRRNQKRMRNEQQQDPSKSVELSTFSSNIETGTQ